MAELPEKIGHYKIVSQLGRGGMGVVYKAREESLNRFVAIKVLTEALTEDATFLQRFVREAQAAAGLSHPNIVQIFYIGEDQGHPYFVMDYVTGRSLHSLIREEGRVGNPRASQLILQAAHGLAAAHDQGVIHRDIKPANLMLDERGLVKIADFGLALPADAETRLTATGMLMGTPGYLAPEQCRGEKVDNRTDIYALGVTFYELLSGSLPFRGESPLALLRQILDEEPPDIATLNPDLDAETLRILQKMIAKDRTARYQDCHQIVADLEEYLSTHGVRSMTAGLSTRKPVTSPGAAKATEQAAATEVLAARGEKGASPSSAQDTPTAFVPAGTPATLPNVPLAGPATLIQGAPVAQPVAPEAATSAAGDTMVSRSATPMAAAAVTPAIAPQRSSSRSLIIVLFLLLIAGGSLAAFFAMKMFGGRKSVTVEAGQSSLPPPVSSSQAASSTTSNLSNSPPRGIADSGTSSNVLLTQPVNTATIGGTPQDVAPQQPNTQQTAPPVSLRDDSATRAGQTTQPSVGNGDSRPRSPSRTAPFTVASRAAPSVPEPVSRPATATLKGVAVAVTGDQTLRGPVANVLTSELSAAGLEATDAESLPSTEGLLRGGEVSAGRLIDRLRAEGLAILLLARADPAGERQLSYLGTSETAYSARVTLTTYDLATGKPFGSRASATIEYTPRSVERETEKVIGRLARKTAEAIQSH